jgi:hypothetical protein
MTTILDVCRLFVFNDEELKMSVQFKSTYQGSFSKEAVGNQPSAPLGEKLFESSDTVTDKTKNLWIKTNKPIPPQREELPAKTKDAWA